MRELLCLCLLCSPIGAFIGLNAQEWPSSKRAASAMVEAHRNALVAISDSIWGLAETAFHETQSSALLADYAEAQGMRVERGLAGMPTAFIASYGSGKPIIGILGEFDALPGVSQRALPYQEPLKEGAAGHGCGHNLFGAGSMGAALAIKELIEQGELQGTIRFYGTPAEEKFFGKLYFARAGLFDDLDACLDWHPSAETKADVNSNLALIDFTVEFRGQSAHAALDPWNGRSAGDGLEMYVVGINYLREHIKPSVRIHYQIQESGKVANVVPAYARIWTRVRDNSKMGMLEVYERVREIARGASIMAGVDYEISLISGLHEIIVNRAGGEALQKNLELLGPIRYTEAELEFARQLQRNNNKPPLGIDAIIRPLEPTVEQIMGASSDVGDVSWIVPEIRLAVTTAPVGTPWHSWSVVACGGMSIGHKGLVYAAKALAMTMIDLFSDEELLTDVRTEFEQRRAGTNYEVMLPPGPPPIEAARP